MLRELQIFLTLAVFLPVATLAADIDAGKALYEPCIECHGADGAGNNALNSPGIAGQGAFSICTESRRRITNRRRGRSGQATAELKYCEKRH